MVAMGKESKAVQAAGLAIVLLALLVLAAGPAGTHWGLWRPLTGFILFMGAAVVGGVLGLILSLAGLWAARGAKAGSGAAKSALLLSLAMLAVIVAAVAMGSRVPAIHDIATDMEDPPAFEQAVHMPANRGRDLAYPHGSPDTPALQREAYPDIETLRLEAAPAEAFKRALQAAHDLGWSTTWSNHALMRFEAYDRTAFFAFEDDVSVRVRPHPQGGSIVDVRSTSRVGRSDFGTNAERVRNFLKRVENPPSS